MKFNSRRLHGRDNFDGSGKNKNLNEILDNEIILDIGKNTIKISKKDK